ncbi:hypothetical protein, partial [Salmonella sp. SAL4447]|uniref:hypothetical protein n=1 Tax=Salmonella sp. SAL4447 TaxID=3159902 RepID=UPI003979B8B5
PLPGGEGINATAGQGGEVRARSCGRSVTVSVTSAAPPPPGGGTQLGPPGCGTAADPGMPCA